jgi:rhodanese-related sulfurtransferase
MTLPHKRHNPGFLALVADARTRVSEIDAPGLGKLIASGEPFLLVDVREESEWEAGHAAGAIHLSKGIIERDIETCIPSKDQRLILYCGGGYRSVLAADNLKKMGYTNAVSLAGGWRAYVSEGLPVEER